MKRSLGLISALLLSSLATAGMAEPGPARQQELRHLVRQDCGSCHGMRLTGGLGLPLTAAALRDKPAEGLAAAIRHGRPGTAMPAWRAILDEADVQWIVTALMAGFPEE